MLFSLNINKKTLQYFNYKNQLLICSKEDAEKSEKTSMFCDIISTGSYMSRRKITLYTNR